MQHPYSLSLLSQLSSQDRASSSCLQQLPAPQWCQWLWLIVSLLVFSFFGSKWEGRKKPWSVWMGSWRLQVLHLMRYSRACAWWCSEGLSSQQKSALKRNLVFLSPPALSVSQCQQSRATSPDNGGIPSGIPVTTPGGSLHQPQASPSQWLKDWP